MGRGKGISIPTNCDDVVTGRARKVSGINLPHEEHSSDYYQRQDEQLLHPSVLTDQDEEEEDLYLEERSSAQSITTKLSTKRVVIKNTSRTDSNGGRNSHDRLGNNETVQVYSEEEKIIDVTGNLS